MQASDDSKSNHEVTLCLTGGAVLGPFYATWSTDAPSDVRELFREYDRFLQGEAQQRFKFHLHDVNTNSVHTIMLDFRNLSALCDHVRLNSHKQGTPGHG